MRKDNNSWTIAELQRIYKNIEFPEFQREPTVWPLHKKQLLIDSIFRGLDISTIYLVAAENPNGGETNGEGGSDEPQDFYECIDGRQRINAILSFLGLNEADDPSGTLHNKFAFQSTNEMRPKEILSEIDGKTFEQLSEEQDSPWVKKFLDYEFNVLEILETTDKGDELNLMFLRLQGGSGLNPGEKLRAMKGRMHDLIFGGTTTHGMAATRPIAEEPEAAVEEEMPPLGKHPFFDYLSIPNRRYAREQVAVQVAMNFFSKKKDGNFHRARFVDLQGFIADYASLTKEDEEHVAELRTHLDLANLELRKDKELRIRNRAIGVSTFFFISELVDQGRQKDIPKFLEFLEKFLPKLKEQVEKGINIDEEYRDLLKFQTYVSQAAIEKYAIDNRQAFLNEYFAYYLEHGEIKAAKLTD
jgi:hypothetical protein